MANSLVTQMLQDGPRNAVMKIVGILDSGDLSNQVIVNPATLSSMMPAMSGNFSPNFVALKQIDFVVEDGLECRLYWDGGSPMIIEDLTGRGHSHYSAFGPLQNNAGNPNGKITLSTQGWTAGSTLSFTLMLWMMKQDGKFYTDISTGGSFNFSNAANGATIVIL